MHIMIHSMPATLNAASGKVFFLVIIMFCLTMNDTNNQIQEHNPLTMEEEVANRPSSELRRFKSAKRHAMTWKELED